MLRSVLTYVPSGDCFEAPIDVSVALAAPSSARVHGLTVLDNRAAESACLIESAATAAAECERLNESARRTKAARSRLERVCRQIDLPCDSRVLHGDPRRLLRREAQFHDLVVAGLDDPSRRTTAGERVTFAELVDLVRRGVEPMLIVRPNQRLPQRVLLAYDGSNGAARAIRALFHLGLAANAECRLLVVAAHAAAAQDAFRSMADYCFARRPDIEMGWTVGALSRVLPGFAKRWHADLAVTRAPRWPRYFPFPRGGAAWARALPRCAFLLCS